MGLCSLLGLADGLSTHSMLASPAMTRANMAIPHDNALSFNSLEYCPEGPTIEKLNIEWSREMFNPYGLKVSIPDWKFQSWMKSLISIESFNPDLYNSPQRGALLCGSLEIFNLDWNFQSEIGRLTTPNGERNIELFHSLGPLGSSPWSFLLSGADATPPLSHSRV